MQKGLSHLIIEMDSVVAVNLVQNVDLLSAHPLAGLIFGCTEFLRQIGHFEIHHIHIYREKNSVADCLVAWSYNLDLGCCFFEEAPVWLSSILLDDLLGACKPSSVSCL